MIISKIVSFIVENTKEVKFLTEKTDKVLFINEAQHTAQFPIDIVPSSNWILTTGFWNDGGIWEDSNIWID